MTCLDGERLAVLEASNARGPIDLASLLPQARAFAHARELIRPVRGITLKVDVDTLRGTREGVPRLAQLLRRLNIPATFLFSLGPDHTGRALRRIFRRGFLSKVRRTSVASNYGIRTLLYGTLLPGPDIGRLCRAEMLEVAAQGFEVGVHAFDHVKWQDGVAGASLEWTREQMALAVEAFERIFGFSPRVHGAAGWQSNEHVPMLEQQFGFEIGVRHARTDALPARGWRRPANPDDTANAR